MSTWLSRILASSNVVDEESRLPKGHPLKICADRVHSPLVDTDPWTVVQERLFGVVQVAVSIPVCIIGNLCERQLLARRSNGIANHGHPTPESKETVDETPKDRDRYDTANHVSIRTSSPKITCKVPVQDEFDNHRV